jgi:hypothetical protein
VTSQNLYANDTAIIKQTGGVNVVGSAAFTGASPWYHFEFFNTGELTRMALAAEGAQDPATGPAPNTNPRPVRDTRITPQRHAALLLLLLPLPRAGGFCRHRRHLRQY